MGDLKKVIDKVNQFMDEIKNAWKGNMAKR